MSKVLVTEQYLRDIGSAIRSKINTEDTFTPSQMADAVLSISSNDDNVVPNIETLRVTPSEEEQVFTAEGNVTGYSPVIVDAVDIPEQPLWTNTGIMYYKKLEIPDGTTSIGSAQQGGSFGSCIQLETVIIPNSVETIWKYSFSGCTNLTEVSFGSGITTIDAHAFNNCKSLKKIDLINSALTSVSSASFLNCTSVETLTLPATLTGTITSNNSQGSFNNCSSLKYVTLEDGFLCSLNLSSSTKYSVETIVNMFNALGTVPEGVTKTLTLGATNLAKLTDTQKQIATDKGWTLA